jgi:hypothetical protein
MLAEHDVFNQDRLANKIVNRYLHRELDQQTLWQTLVHLPDEHLCSRKQRRHYIRCQQSTDADRKKYSLYVTSLAINKTGSLRKSSFKTRYLPRDATRSHSGLPS